MIDFRQIYTGSRARCEHFTDKNNLPYTIKATENSLRCQKATVFSCVFRS